MQNKSLWRMVACTVSLPVRLIDYGLRDYGTAKWEGGDPNCEHTVGSGDNDNLKTYVTRPERDGIKRQYCQKCGAVRIDQQIGLEQTPAEYVNDIVQVFREVWRILRDDGTVWLNLGDSYNGSGGAGGDYIEGGLKEGQPKYPGRHINNLKLKDLIGIPWMVAFALRDDGWWLRQDIIWHKPNPMPESVKDRCTKAHEYVFLLTKSSRYYYDNEAVKEPSKEPNDNRGERGNRKRFPTEKIAGIRGPGVYPMANKRSVWTVPTSPYRGAHYATFPPKLIEPMILAGCPAGGNVLDPFVGSGTTIMVANELGRRGIGLDLSFKYLQENAKERLATVQPIMFN